MNRNDYKKLMNRIEPDEGMEERLMKDMNRKVTKQARSRWDRIGMASVSMAVVLGVVLVISLVWSQQAGQDQMAIGEPQVSGEDGTPPTSGNHESVTIPKIELPDDSGVSMSMIGLVVYQGNIYTQSGTGISPETAKALRGEKLGRSKSGITEWSTSSDYTELASTIGEMDIYSVQGYDTEFRIMSYAEHDGQIFAELYEHLNGITVHTGEDVVGKLKLLDRMISANWQDFDSWNMGEVQLNELAVDEALQAFVQALYEAKPVAAEALYEAGIYETGAEEQKFLHLKLEDETQVQLRLFKSGPYVRYGNAEVFLQLDKEAFDALWERME
ncbi:hypothetical protein [Paenibacillus sp. JCM 10914]|uniref:hypothetical protein n=1 Tax=Paenibacillus sp. JCM 10914 TaxID=1236974 RepID=UPI0003CC698A|nr:hypothetical protein [Paenibacillus sp. JCM 10914]GAE05940.1 hypothetical protein JCM10914_2072 [Paenibacillus sp. JCM 10914]